MARVQSTWLTFALLRDHFLGRFEDGATVEQVAKELRTLLAIVKITEDERKTLDSSLTAGDTFAPLRLAGIEFEPPAEFGCLAAGGPLRRTAE